MFTGIVEELGTVKRMADGRLTVAASRVLQGTARGDSIAVNGTCLTVTGVGKGWFAVDVVPETLRRTNLGALRAGDTVDLERALAYGQRMGGHLVQGHIDGTGVLTSVKEEGNSNVLRFRVPARLGRYLVEKGFVAVDGVSLTVVKAREQSFTVAVVPQTKRVTTLGRRKVGESVNIEVDILAKYARKALRGHAR